MGEEEFDSVFDQFFGPKNPEQLAEHDKIRSETVQQFKRDKESEAERKQSLQSSLGGIGISSAIMGGLGTMMFGMGGKNPEFKEYIHATIDGFMSYLEVEREENKRLQEELSQTKEQLEKAETAISESITQIGEHNQTIVELTAQLNIVAAEALKLVKAKQDKSAKKKATRRKKK